MAQVVKSLLKNVGHQQIFGIWYNISRLYSDYFQRSKTNENLHFLILQNKQITELRAKLLKDQQPVSGDYSQLDEHATNTQPTSIDTKKQPQSIIGEKSESYTD